MTLLFIHTQCTLAAQNLYLLHSVHLHYYLLYPKGLLLSAVGVEQALKKVCHHQLLKDLLGLHNLPINKQSSIQYVLCTYKTPVVSYKNRGYFSWCPWARQLSHKLQHTGSLHMPGICSIIFLSSWIHLTSQKFLKCQRPTWKQVLHLLKTLLNQ